jgi:type II secretory pathway component PulF
MPNFAYTALDEQSTPVTGTIEAAGRGQAIAALAERKLFVTRLDEGAAGAAGTTTIAQTQQGGVWGSAESNFSWPWANRPLRPRVKATMLRQLATALQAGLPLLSALRAVEQQAENATLQAVMRDLAEKVQGGQALSAAMHSRPRDFTALESSMVRVGETAGVLDQVMAHLSDFAERDVEISHKIHSAATYPIFVLVLAGISVVVIITVILPRVMAVITEGTGTALLPWPTRVLLGTSDFLTSIFGWLLLAALAAGVWAFRAWARRPAGRLAVDSFKLRVPVLRTAIRRVAVARFARTLGTLCQSGIQILEALRVLRDTLGNEALARRVDEVAGRITQGQSIAEPLRSTGQFPALLTQVIALGEKTGKLDEMLLKTADVYEKETSAAIDRLMTILPAAMIVLLAGVVGFILAAVLLPILEMQGSIPGI